MTRPDVARLTNLFEGNWAGLLPGHESMGAAETWENVSEGESGPVLERGLLFCDMGIVDSLLIHEPLEEIESLLTVSSVRSCGDDKSPFRTIDSLLPPPLLLLSIRGLIGRWCMTGGRIAGEEPRAWEKDLFSGVITVELVGGRDIGDDRSWALLSTSARSPAFLFLEEGRTGVELSGLPSARPAAATPTVLEATSLKIFSICIRFRCNGLLQERNCKFGTCCCRVILP